MSKKLSSSSEDVTTSEGWQYHTDLELGDLADIILLVVDPARAKPIIG